MALTSFLERGQRAAERLMVDSVSISRLDRSLPPIRNTATGEETYPEEVVYEGFCKVQRYDGQTSFEENVAEREFTSERVYLHIPVGIADVHVDDIATITASADPNLVGVPLTVKATFAKTWGTARRILVEQITS